MEPTLVVEGQVGARRQHFNATQLVGGELVVPVGDQGAEAHQRLCAVGVQPQRLVELGQRLGDAPPGFQGESQVVVGGGVSGIDADGLTEVAHRLVELVQVAQGQAEVAVRLGEVRAQADGLAQVGGGRLGLVAGQQGAAQVVAGLGVSWGEADGLLQQRQRLAEPLLPLEDGAEVAAGVDVAGVEAQGGAEGALGLGQAAQAAQGDAEVVLGVGEVRLQAHGLAAMSHGVFEVAQGEVDGGQVAVEDGVRAVDGQRPEDQVAGLLVAARLVGQHAEQVQGVGVLRRVLKDGAVEGLGLLPAAGLVMPNRQGQALGDREHGVT